MWDVGGLCGREAMGPLLLLLLFVMLDCPPTTEFGVVGSSLVVGVGGVTGPMSGMGVVGVLEDVDEVDALFFGFFPDTVFSDVFLHFARLFWNHT